MENSDWKDKLALAFNIDVENIDNQPDEPQEVKHDIDKRSPLKIMLDKKNRSGCSGSFASYRRFLCFIAAISSFVQE